MMLLAKNVPRGGVSSRLDQRLCVWGKNPAGVMLCPSAGMVSGGTGCADDLLKMPADGFLLCSYFLALCDEKVSHRELHRDHIRVSR